MAADGWISVETTKELEENGRWAVAEYNRKTKRSLIFLGVVVGFKFVLGQVTIYPMLLMCANEFKSIGLYKAVVGVVFRKKWLLYFEQLVGWTDVKDFQSSIEIDDYSRFAVDEYSKQQERLIIFRRVVAAQQQEVAGVNYHLIHPRIVNSISRDRVLEGFLW